MGLAPDTLIFDCARPRLVAAFWAESLGWDLDPESDEADVYVRDPSGRTAGIFFQAVPEPKITKNRVHLDVRPTGSMAEEVARLESLGATIRGFIEEGGSFWTQMRDVEGNEFCVLRGPEDGWSPGEL